MNETEVRRNNAGKRIFSSQFKQKIIAEVEAGSTVGEVARKYGIVMQNIHRWMRLARNASDGALKANEDMVPVSELKKAQEEIKQLRQALGKMTLDRDILKDAVEIAAKKKWI